MLPSLAEITDAVIPNSLAPNIVAAVGSSIFQVPPVKYVCSPIFPSTFEKTLTHA